jgi:hypothetical protein
MTKLLAAALFVMIAFSIAVSAVPAATAANERPVPPSFDVAMPAPQEPFDTTPITPIESAGAARAE